MSSHNEEKQVESEQRTQFHRAVSDESPMRDPLLQALFDNSINEQSQEDDTGVLAFVGRVSASISAIAERQRRRNRLIGIVLLALMAVFAATPTLREIALDILLLPTWSLIEVDTLGNDSSPDIFWALLNGPLAPLNSIAGLLGVIAFFMRKTLFRLILRR